VAIQVGGPALLFNSPSSRYVRGESLVIWKPMIAHATFPQHMRYVPLAIVAAAAVLAFSGTVRAADSSGTYSFWGAGKITCKAYGEMAAAQNADFEKVTFWMGGYITAFNRLIDKTYDIVTKDSNVSTVMLWMLHYCNEHGDAILTKAAEEFTNANMNKRQVSHP
jgi:hypothetical protein